MAIPNDIKQIKRPSNTRVKNINGKYKVYSRTSIRDGKRVIPIELGAVGEIVNGKYVAFKNPQVKDAEEARQAYRVRHCLNGKSNDIPAAIESKDSTTEDASNENSSCHHGRKRKETIYTIKVSGPVDLMDRMGDGLLQELTDVFGIEDAKFIYVIALLRAAFGEIKNRDLDEEYETSKASVMYPGVGLSEKTVSTNLKRIGYNTLSMIKFWKSRVKANLSNGVIVVDGSLVDFNSSNSAYSEFSRKAMTKGSKDALVLTAYSIELQEPLCEEIYPGNMLDMVAYEDFSKKYELDSAIVVARPTNEEYELHSVEHETDENNKTKKINKLVDVKLFDKGYSSETVIKRLINGGHNYLVAIKNDRTEIKEYQLDNPCEHLKEYKEDIVMYKKVKVSENRFLYAFKCPRMGCVQNSIYVINEEKNKRFSAEKYDLKKSTFGLIVFESNLDLKPYEVYSSYDDRWKIEPYEKLRKSIMENGSVNVHSDASVRATVFINGISNIMGCRLMKIMKKTGVAKHHSIKEVLRRLGHFMEQMDENGDWHPTARIKKSEKIARLLELV